ncbi:MAG: hypothetical protein GY861_05340 [bacterium]|nr:hypothetical protein [bacterium]
MELRDLENFYLLLSEKGVLIDKEKGTDNAVYWANKFYETLPKGEVSSVSENEQTKEVCPVHKTKLYKHPNGNAYCSLCDYVVKWTN